MGAQLIKLDEHFKNGLAPDQRVQRNMPFLETCQNLRPTRFGLKDFINISQPFTDSYITSTLGLNKTWPRPQIFRGKKTTYMIGETATESKLYILTENVGSDWTAAVQVINDGAQFGATTPSVVTIPTGGTWHFMDFYDTAMFFSGNAVVFKMAGQDSRWWRTTVPGINTGWAFKEGRGFLAGFTPSNYYSSAWRTFFQDLDDNLPANILAMTDFTAGADTNWVWWSTIGGGDLAWMFSNDFGVYGNFDRDESNGYNAANPYIHDLFMRNEYGARPMPWQGTVQMGQELGQGCIVYGDKGVSGLAPYITSPADGSVSGMGLVPIVGFGERLGIASRSAAGGNMSQHLMVDEAGELWRITPAEGAFQAERLGYGEIFVNMLGNDILVSYDEHRNEFYIGDSTNETYVFNANGLGGPAPKQPTTVSFAQGGLVGVFFDAAATDAVIIKTERITFPEPTELIAVFFKGKETNTNQWTMEVHYRMDNRTTTADSTVTGIAIRNNGKTDLNNITVVDMQLRFLNDDKDDCDLEYVEIEVSQGGKKSLRRLL